MTRTVQVSLGNSQLTGKQGIDQAKWFKEQIISVQKKPGTVSMLAVVGIDPPTIGVVTVYDADDPAAAEWVKQAETLSTELWQKMAERRRVPAK